LMQPLASAPAMPPNEIATAQAAPTIHFMVSSPVCDHNQTPSGRTPFRGSGGAPREYGGRGWAAFEAKPSADDLAGMFAYMNYCNRGERYRAESYQDA
jgi:hypothetical protein